MEISLLVLALSGFVVFYAYAGYPAVLLVLSKLKRHPVKKCDITPSVSLIIAAYNEESDIAEKLRNSLSLNYESGKLEIIVASDCSTDRTDEIVRGFAESGVKLCRLRQRGGKTAAQNLAVAHAKGEILVFSDATTVYEKDSLRKLVRSFADPSVGAVGGNLVFVEKGGNVLGEELGLHRRQEQWLKKKEGEIRSILGVEGCIYAMRRELYTPIDEHLTSDFAAILMVIEQGYRVVHETEAIAYEEAALSIWGEFKRKVRTIHGGMGVVKAKRYLLNPLRWGFVSFSLFSHKIIRWTVPFCLILLLVSNLTLVRQGAVFQYLLTAQLMFYAMAAGGALLEKYQIDLKPFNLSFYFCFINLAAVAGFQSFLRGQSHVVWQTERARE